MNFEIPKPLLSWMEQSGDNNSRLYGWDMIIALPLELLNAALQHDGLQQLSLDQGIAGLSGSVPIDDSTQQYQLEGYRLSNLALQVAATNYGTPRVKVTAELEGGVLIRTQGLDAILTLSEHLPFSGIDAGLELPISYNTGKLGASLKDGLAHELAVSDGEVGRENAATLFKNMLLGLEVPRAQVQLAQVQVNDDNVLRRVKDMHLRTQVDGNTRVAADEAPPSNVLLFVNFEHGGPVDYPRVGDTFPYLLGSDGEGGQGCTALLSRHLLHRVAFGQSIMASLQGGDYSFADTSEQPLPRIDVNQGSMSVSNGLHNSALLNFDYDAFTLDAASGTSFYVEFEPDRATQTWGPRCHINFRYKVVGAEEWTPHSVVVQPQLNYSLQLREADGTGDLLEGRWLAAQTQSALIEGLPEQLPVALQDEMASALEQIVRAGYLNAVNARPQVRVTDQLLPFLRLFDTRVLRWQVGATPNNQVVVGAFEKAEDQFRIVQQNAQLVAGHPFTFTVKPPRPGVKWRVEELPGNPIDPDCMDEESGTFTPPPAPGGSLRVKVVAKDPVTGMSSSTLVTVSVIGMMVAPLFAYLKQGHGGPSEQVRFMAASLGQEAADYTWDVVGEEGVKGGIEAESDTSVAVYTAGARQKDRTYVVDRILMTNNTAGVQRMGVVVSEHGTPELTIVPAAKVTERGLKLEAYYGENEEPLKDIDWTKQGPGDIVDDYYIPDPNSADAFVVIIGTYNYDGHRYQGHLVRPLPLDRFPRLSAAQAMRKRGRQQVGTREPMPKPIFELQPKGPLAVGPGHKVQFTFPLISSDKVVWTVERVEGDPQFKGTVDGNGVYTAGITDTGADRIIAEAWGLGSLIADSYADIRNIPDMPVWESLQKFDLQTPSFVGEAQIYGNGHMQLEVLVQVGATGIPIQFGEVESLRLFSESTGLQLPEYPEALPKERALWAVNRNRNAYDLAGQGSTFTAQDVPGILEEKTYYLLSRENKEETLTFYAGLMDRHGAWHYSMPGDSTRGNPKIRVKVLEHVVNPDEYSFIRDRIRPQRRGSEDEDFDLELNTADYWRLQSATNRRFFQAKVLSGDADADERSSMAVWEDDHDQVELISYTGWAFWSAQEGKTRPEKMAFDIKGLTTMTSNLKEEAHLNEEIDPDHFNNPGLMIANLRNDSVSFAGSDRDYVKKYKNSLLFKLQDSQGNTIDLWVSYDAEHATRYRDKIVVRGAKPGSEW